MSSLMLLRGNNTAARHQGAIDLFLLKFWGPHYSLASLSLLQTAANNTTCILWTEGSCPKDLIFTELEKQDPFLVSSSVSFVGLLLHTLAICFHVQISENLVTEKVLQNTGQNSAEKHEMPKKKRPLSSPPHDFKRLQLITSEPST